MLWIAPTETDSGAKTLEERLWEAADQFRANSGLKAGQYSQPVLGLIFLRFAEARFAAREAMSLAFTGLGIGLIVAFAFDKLLSKFLYNVSTTDPLTFLLVPLILLLGTVLACLVPRLRAAAVEPMEALRHE